MTKKSNHNRRNGISGQADPQTERLLGEHWFSSADRGTVEQEVKTAIYVRYSPRPDEKEASVERQIEMCKAYLERIGAPQPTQDRIFVDRMLSGAHSHRPAYQALLRDLAAGGHTMAVAEFSDRLTRDLGELGRVHKLYEHYGAKLHFAMQGTLPPAMIALHGFLSMEQRSQLILRTTEGRRRAASAGRSVGKRPYGYRAMPGSRGVLVVEQGEAAIVRRIFTEYVRGASVRSIVLRLNGEGIPSPAGKVWTQQTVSSHSGLLRRSLYAGCREFGSTRWRRDPFTQRMVVQDVPVGARILTPMPDLAIVDEATWVAAQTRLKDARKTVAKPTSVGGRLLTGHIYCPCGSRIRYIGTRDRPRLTCTAHLQMGTCDRKRTIAAAVIEGDVLRLIRDGVDMDARQASESASKPKNGPRVHRSRRNELRRRMGSIDAELASCISAETEGMSGERLAAKRERLEAEVARIGAEIQRLEAQACDTPSRHDESLGVADAFATMLVRTPLDIRTTADRAMANVFRRIAGKIEIDLSQEDRSYRIRIALADPPENMARGHILERTYDRPRFGFLKDPDLVKRAYAAADRELFALADEDWDIVAHLFAGYAWRCLEPRRALDALLFHAWTGVPIARTPPKFGGASTLRGSGILLVRSGNWRRVLTLLTAAGSPVVEGIDTGYFDSWMTGRKP